jgi:hypothetical protein
LQLELLSPPHAVCRFEPQAQVPGWADVPAAPGSLISLTRSAEELSLVCPESLLPDDAERSGGWRVLRVAGTLDHGMTGVLASLAAPLAEAAIPIFAVSTFDTDYLLVPERGLGAAIRALRVAGHEIDDPEGR